MQQGLKAAFELDERSVLEQGGNDFDRVPPAGDDARAREVAHGGLHGPLDRGIGRIVPRLCC